MIFPSVHHVPATLVFYLIFKHAKLIPISGSLYWLFCLSICLKLTVPRPSHSLLPHFTLISAPMNFCLYIFTWLDSSHGSQIRNHLLRKAYFICPIYSNYSLHCAHFKSKLLVALLFYYHYIIHNYLKFSCFFVPYLLSPHHSSRMCFPWRQELSTLLITISLVPRTVSDI